MPESTVENPMLAAWERTWKRRGDKAAVLGTAGVVQRTFDDIEREARELAGRFAGLAPRSVIGVQIGNHASWPALLIALFRTQLVPVPLGETSSGGEMQRALAACRASALVLIEKGRFVVQATSPAPEIVAWPEPAPDFLKLTSGTTGTPRAIRFRAGQLLADCDHICASMGITDADLNFGVIPFSHSYGFSNLITPLVCRGVPLVATGDRIPRAVLNGLVQTGATVLPATPLLFQKMEDTENAPALPKLRLCISAGAPLPKGVAERFTARFGVKIHAFYGSSECGGITYDASEEIRYEEGFVGTPLRGVEVMQEAENPGAISIRSAAVGDGFFAAGDDRQLAAGVYRPGDLVRRTERGIYLAGRVSDWINVAGRKLNPLEVEERLAQFPGIKQAVVFGVESALRGEEPVACIAGEGIDREALLRFCRARLSAWQVPRDLWFVPEIPANERGKISRKALAESYATRRGFNKAVAAK